MLEFFKQIWKVLKCVFSNKSKFFLGTNTDNSININGDNNFVKKGTQITVENSKAIFRRRGWQEIF